VGEMLHYTMHTPDAHKNVQEVYFIEVNKILVNLQRERFVVLGSGLAVAKHRFSFFLGS
jgi:hypothetical protein